VTLVKGVNICRKESLLIIYSENDFMSLQLDNNMPVFNCSCPSGCTVRQ
jgi:hypothetical protein